MKSKTTKAQSGRPSKYDPAFLAQAYKLALLWGDCGADRRLFRGERRYRALMDAETPRFADALKSGRQDADANVAKSLYRRAIGYKRKSEKNFCLKDGTDWHRRDHYF